MVEDKLEKAKILAQKQAQIREQLKKVQQKIEINQNLTNIDSSPSKRSRFDVLPVDVGKKKGGSGSKFPPPPKMKADRVEIRESRRERSSIRTRRVERRDRSPPRRGRSPRRRRSPRRGGRSPRRRERSPRRRSPGPRRRRDSFPGSYRDDHDRRSTPIKRRSSPRYQPQPMSGGRRGRSPPPRQERALSPRFRRSPPPARGRGRGSDFFESNVRRDEYNVREVYRERHEYHVREEQRSYREFHRDQEPLPRRAEMGRRPEPPARPMASVREPPVRGMVQRPEHAREMMRGPEHAREMPRRPEPMETRRQEPMRAMRPEPVWSSSAAAAAVKPSASDPAFRTPVATTQLPAHGGHVWASSAPVANPNSVASAFRTPIAPAAPVDSGFAPKLVPVACPPGYIAVPLSQPTMASSNVGTAVNSQPMNSQPMALISHQAAVNTNAQPQVMQSPVKVMSAPITDVNPSPTPPMFTIPKGYQKQNHLAAPPGLRPPVAFSLETTVTRHHESQHLITQASTSSQELQQPAYSTHRFSL